MIIKRIKTLSSLSHNPPCVQCFCIGAYSYVTLLGEELKCSKFFERAFLFKKLSFQSLCAGEQVVSAGLLPTEPALETHWTRRLVNAAEAANSLANFYL